MSRERKIDFIKRVLSGQPTYIKYMCWFCGLDGVYETYGNTTPVMKLTEAEFQEYVEKTGKHIHHSVWKIKDFSKGAA